MPKELLLRCFCLYERKRMAFVELLDVGGQLDGSRLQLRDDGSVRAGRFVGIGGEDHIIFGNSIRINQTITSPNDVFALGFFTPSNSSTNRQYYYLGIWYNKILPPTVIWVANRDNPLKDSSGFLTITSDGNLAVLNGDGNIIWSSNASTLVQNGTGTTTTTAVLTDTGNLVLSLFDEETTLWQSYDDPFGSFLPGMRLSVNLKTGKSIRLVSWKGENDPSSGPFSLGVDPQTPRQLIIWNGSSDVYTRSDVWQSTIAIGRPEENRDYVGYVTIVTTDNEAYIQTTLTNNSVMLRYVLTPMGRFQLLSWHQDSKEWRFLKTIFQRELPCYYNRCGPFASCNNDTSGSPSLCKCLRGYYQPNIQKDCERRKPFECGRGDGFFKLERMKLPDFSISLGNLSQTDCEMRCRGNCSCTAYAYNSLSSWGIWRCLIWETALVDLVETRDSTVDLYIRLVSSELGGNDNKTRLLVLLITTVASGILLFGVFGFFLRRKFKTTVCRRDNITNELRGPSTFASGESNLEPPKFNFRTIAAATDNFSTVNKLGEGGFGPVYKGKLPDGQLIAVKRLSKSSGQGLEEFKNEVQLIARLQHRNLVRLLGCCIHGEEMILIYEFMLNKSLDRFIFEPLQDSPIDWKTRFHIVEGIAQGLLYLHRHSRLRIIHRDLKTSNILLDGEMNPKISDFGLARIVEGNHSKVNTKRVAGTYGYMSPEYALNGTFSEKSDVFSFGVLLLEIVSGKRNTSFYPHKQWLSLLSYVWQLWEEGRAVEVVDPLIGNSYNPQEVRKCIHVGLLCVQEYPNDRPTMSSVVFMLGSDNATLPAPKQPAFSSTKDLVSLYRAADASLNFSLNWVTLTTIEPK